MFNSRLMYTKTVVKLITMGLVLTACTSNTSRYQLATDKAPQEVPEVIDLSDATPQYHPYYPHSLNQYEVLGKRYQPLGNALHYGDEGYASWYGQKFHGHLTSNGETYDMFEMTAAHKFLPLPTYVRVVNVENDRSVIVKINDRGPFHDDRIIDLSYAAAKKLDMLAKGTAKVRITSIVVDDQGWHYEAGKRYSPETIKANKPLTTLTINESPVSKSGLGRTNALSEKQLAYYIQVIATSDLDYINRQGVGLATLLQTQFLTKSELNLHKLQLGPFYTESDARTILEQVRLQGYPKAFLVHPVKL